MGLFSETSIGTFQENNHMKLNENVNKIITLDAEWLMLLVYKFESEYYNSLSFTINNACYKKVIGFINFTHSLKIKKN